MEYLLIPILVIGMLGYMFWRSAAHLRRDRVMNERELTRGRHAFTPRHRLRFLLGRAFRVREDEEPDWQAELKSSLDKVPKEPQDRAGA
ncbi:MAG TPA: hypothetical protein VNT77_02310 [Allosphingosinicella sp.]|nr:hypothetical protein [Allosphingosinicella sp.]